MPPAGKRSLARSLLEEEVEGHLLWLVCGGSLREIPVKRSWLGRCDQVARTVNAGQDGVGV